MSFAVTCVNLETFILSEVSQTDMEKYRMTSYMWNPKGNDTNELIIQKVTHRLKERTYGLPGEGWEEGIVREFGIDIYT